MELPKNPNTRPPYSDVALELDVTLGWVMEYVGVRFPDESPEARAELRIKMAQLDQARLRVRAVLDPTALTDEEWERAQKTAWEVGIAMRDAK